MGFNLEVVEKRILAVIHPDLVYKIGTHNGDLLQNMLVDFTVVDENFPDVGTEVIADCPMDNIAFLMDQERSRTALRGHLNHFPLLYQDLEIPVELLGGLADTGRADDNPHAVGNGQGIQSLFELDAIISVNAMGNSAGVRIVRHQNNIGTGKGNVGGQSGALEPAFLLFNLNDDFLTFPDGVLKTLPVGEGVSRLEVLPGDFLQGQKTVPIHAVINKSRLEAGLDAGDDSLVDVGFFLLVADSFDIQVIDLLAVNKCNTHLLFLSCVY